MSECKICHQEITWTKQKDEKGETRNVPLNLNGSRHSCMKGSSTPSSSQGAAKGGEYPVARGIFVSHLQPNIIIKVDSGDRTYYVGKEKWPYVTDLKPGQMVEFSHSKNGNIGWISPITGENQKPPVNTAAEIKAEQEEVKKKAEEQPEPKRDIRQKSGILLSHFPTGCTIRLADGDFPYALANNPFPMDTELPQRIEFSVENGIILSWRLFGKAQEGEALQKSATEILRENIEQAEKEAKTPKPTTTPPEAAAMAPQGQPKGGSGVVEGYPKVIKEYLTPPEPTPPQASGRTLTIGGTINLERFENLKIEISGPVEDWAILKENLKEIALSFGDNDPFTKGQIEGYVRRVFA